jgi:hypothetical protein
MKGEKTAGIAALMENIINTLRGKGRGAIGIVSAGQKMKGAYEL